MCLIAIIGGMSTGTTALYGTGLDVSSMFPRLLNRVRATLLIGTIAIAFIFVGRFWFNLVESVATFSTLIDTFSCPWMAIMVIGYVTRRGYYLADDLQVFNRGCAAAITGSRMGGTCERWARGCRPRSSGCRS